MRRMGVSALLGLSLVGGATAHRLDEYLGQLETEEGQKHARRKKR